MIIPDTNLLVYAYDSECPQHNRALKWWEECLSGSEPVGIPWVVMLAFVRLTTHPTLLENPQPIKSVRKTVQSWLEIPHVRLLSPSPSTTEHFFDMLEKAGSGGNLSTDAHIAALAFEYDACVHTNDHDFARFDSVRRFNPLSV